MSALEQEILKKFDQLDAAAQQRVRALLVGNAKHDTPFDYDTWFQEVKAIRQEIRTNHGGDYPAINVVEILRDIRDSEDE